MAPEFKKRKKKLFERKSPNYIRRCARLPIHSSSQTQGKTTRSVNFTTVLRIPPLNWHTFNFFTGKMIVTASKRYFSIMLQNALLRITQSSHSLSITYLRLLHSGIFAWTFQALWMSKTSCSYQKHCYRQKPLDCLHLMIVEADLLLLVLKRGNLFDENCDEA